MSDEDVCELKRLYVRPAHRGEGIGRALTRQAIGEARALGYRLMRLNTGTFLDASRRLYASLGFAERSPYSRCRPTCGESPSSWSFAWRRGATAACATVTTTFPFARPSCTYRTALAPPRAAAAIDDRCDLAGLDQPAQDLEVALVTFALSAGS